MAWGVIHCTMQRLEEKGLVSFWLWEARAEKGPEAKKAFHRYGI